MSTTERKFQAKDDPKAIAYLLQGREALTRKDFHAAMEQFKKCYESQITKQLATLLLTQMANCMDRLEDYDQQQAYLEELCELEPSFKNVQQVMRVYAATNNDEKKAAFAEKIKKLTTDSEDEEKLAINLLTQAKDHNEVLARSLDWVKKHPDDVDIIKCVINTYIELKRIEEAFEFSEQLAPGIKDMLCMELSSLRKEMFDFEGAQTLLLKHLEMHRENVRGVNIVAHTLVTGACYDGLLKREDYIYWQNRAWEGTKPQTPLNTDFNICTNYFRKIRVGLISYDFRAHSVGKFIMSLFDAISNNTGIETYCYYTCPSHEDNYTAVIKKRADVFRYVGHYPDKHLRKVLLDDRLDILIDLNGQTAGTKGQLLTERFAPMQATWMGFPFSSFYYNIDYIIGDYYFDPVDGETWKYCTEKILRMDPCYMCFAAGVDYYINPEPPQTRNRHITFGMMNGPHKFSEESIRLWQRCLEATPGSRLMIVKSHYRGLFVENNLRERFKKFGLDLSRVDIVTNREGTQGYFGRYNQVDVMLDSLPFGGGTTTPEAIWMGVPVIGCQYHMRHGRMAYSFMTNVGLGHLCADSVKTYPEKACEVAQNLELLRNLRQNLRDRLKDTPLYNTAIFRTAFEGAMRDVFVDYCMENKKPFDPSLYSGDDGRLLRDCIRAADVVWHEIDRERGASGERLSALLGEYEEIHMLMMERLFEIYRHNIDSLSLAEKAARLLELLNNAQNQDLRIVKNLVKSIRTILSLFA